MSKYQIFIRLWRRGAIIIVFGFTFLIIILALYNTGCSDKKTIPDTAKNSGEQAEEDIGTVTKQIANDRFNAALFHKRAQLYLKRKNIDSALDDISVAIKIDSASAPMYLTLAQIHFANADIVLASEALKSCISLAPANIEALLKMAEMQFYMNKMKESISYLKKVTDIDRYNDRAYFIHGMIFKEIGDTAKAISSFQTAAVNNPDNFEAYLQLGLLHYGLQDKLAIDYLDNALHLNPKSIEALYTKGMFFQNAGDIDKAIDTYCKMLDIELANKNAHYNLGYINLKFKKDIPTAIQHFGNAIKTDSAYFQAYYMRGYCKEQLGDYKQARADYEKALRFETNYELAIGGLNRLDAVKSRQPVK